MIHLQGVHISVGWGIIGQDFYHTFFSLPLEPPAGERETARQSEVFEATCNRGPIHSCTPLHLAHSRSSIVMCWIERQGICISFGKHTWSPAQAPPSQQLAKHSNSESNLCLQRKQIIKTDRRLNIVIRNSSLLFGSRWGSPLSKMEIRPQAVFYNCLHSLTPSLGFSSLFLLRGWQLFLPYLQPKDQSPSFSACWPLVHPSRQP